MDGDETGGAAAAIETHGPSIFRYLCTLLDGDDAHDVFSLWAEDLWRGLPEFRGECSLRAWAYRLAWHAACRFRRDAYRARGQRLATSAASRLAASVAASTVAMASRRAGLHRLREKLSPEDQTLLTLRVDRELEWEEIAAVLSSEGEPVTAAALRQRFHRLTERLKDLAREEGLIDTDDGPEEN